MINLAKEIRDVTVKDGELAICWLGQAGFLLKDAASKVLLFDAYLTNCGERLRGFKRVSPMLITPEELTPTYYVTTHIHFDHFDFDAIKLLADRCPDTIFIGPDSCVAEMQKLKIKQPVRLNTGDHFEDETVVMDAIPADHGDMVPDAIGAVIRMGGHCLYFTGDTAFHTDYFEKAASFHPEFAAISANGTFGNLNAEDGVKAAKLSGATYATACHCWTFTEHHGDPGIFYEKLEEEGITSAKFRQGEILMLTADGQLVKPEGSQL